MGIEEEIQAKGIENIFNKIIAENFPNLEGRKRGGHPGTGGFQNTKQPRLEKKHHQTYYNQNTKYTE
jgi:hypothetical protein